MEWDPKKIKQEPTNAIAKLFCQETKPLPNKDHYSEELFNPVSDAQNIERTIERMISTKLAERDMKTTPQTSTPSNINITEYGNPIETSRIINKLRSDLKQEKSKKTTDRREDLLPLDRNLKTTDGQPICNYCKRVGHLAKVCKQRRYRNNSANNGRRYGRNFDFQKRSDGVPHPGILGMVPARPMVYNAGQNFYRNPQSAYANDQNY